MFGSDRRTKYRSENGTLDFAYPRAYPCSSFVHIRVVGNRDSATRRCGASDFSCATSITNGSTEAASRSNLSCATIFLGHANLHFSSIDVSISIVLCFSLLLCARDGSLPLEGLCPAASFWDVLSPKPQFHQLLRASLLLQCQHPTPTKFRGQEASEITRS